MPLNEHLISGKTIQKLFTQFEIRDRQGFDPKEESRRNLSELKAHLQEGGAYINRHISSVTEDATDLRKNTYTISNQISAIGGITENEAIIFAYVSKNLAIKHSTRVKDIKIGDTLKSVRAREYEGSIIDNSRTRNIFGMQHYIYFVAGLGKIISPANLELLPSFTIDLNKLWSDDPEKFSQIYLAPHLSEFKTNAIATPIILGKTKIKINFYENHEIIYTFEREDASLVKKYKLQDFVFYGGHDVIAGIAYRFIELLRFTGNDYLNQLISQLKRDDLTDEYKINFLGKVMAGLMPNSMLLEAKIPSELQLKQEYTQYHSLNTQDNRSRYLWGEDDDNDIPYLGKEAGPLPLEEDQEFMKSILQASSSFAWEDKDQYFAQDFSYEDSESSDSEQSVYDGIQQHDITLPTMAVFETYPNPLKKSQKKSVILEQHIRRITEQTAYTGSSVVTTIYSASYLPADLYTLLISKVIHDKDPIAIPLFKWLIETSFTDEYGISYYININERSHSAKLDLIASIISTRFRPAEDKIELLKITLAKIDPMYLQANYETYIAFAADESFRDIDKNKVLDYLLSLELTIDGSHDQLAGWLQFENNIKLLEFMFDKHKLDINGLCQGKSYLDHAIEAKNYSAAEWLIARGAKTHKCNQDTLQQLPNLIESALPIMPSISRARGAVIAIVTGKINEENYFVIGKRRLTALDGRHRLENRLSLPGGLIDEDESAEQAALRELQEETHLTFTGEQISVRHIATIDVAPSHQELDKISHISLVHIALNGKLKQHVWPGSDLGYVSTARLSSCQFDNNEIPQSWHNIPIRQSNGLILGHIFTNANQPMPDELIPLLQLYFFAESQPDEFIWIALFGEKLFPTVTDALHFIMQDCLSFEEVETTSILIEILKQKDFTLLKKYHEREYKYCGYTPYHKQIIALMEEGEKNIAMLEYIQINMPGLFYCSNDGWKEMKKSLASPSVKLVPEHIIAAIKLGNANHIVTSSLKQICQFKTNKNEIPCDQHTNIIKYYLENYADKVLKKLNSDDIKLAMLSGDVEILKLLLKEPLISKAFLEFGDSYKYSPIQRKQSIFSAGIYITEQLIKQKSTEMLQFLQDSYPVAFHTNKSHQLIELAKKHGMEELAEFIRKKNSPSEYAQHAMYLESKYIKRWQGGF